MEKDVVLFEDKKDCCGCGACYNVCPKQAITMAEDEDGFVYPVIDKDKCIGCGSCKRVCGFQNNPERNTPKKVFGVSSKDRAGIMKSASGGVFFTLAKSVLQDGGFVFGCSLEQEEVLTPKHICVSDIEELSKLQGSKYVQSDIGKTYADVKKILLDGSKVLFSGTPCQVAGLKKFLGKEYENLITVDIVCHGVPGKRMFQDFIKSYENRVKGHFIDFKFRDKARGQGYTTRAESITNGKQNTYIKKGELFAYIFMFSKSLILRKNCYECPFANGNRVSDITIGDFWGFDKVYGDTYPDLNEKYGISCVLCNTEQGIACFEKNIDSFHYVESDFSAVARYNKQLNAPTPKPAARDGVIEAYKNKGYDYLERLYWTQYTKYKIKNIISELIPTSLKRRLKNGR